MKQRLVIRHSDLFSDDNNPSTEDFTIRTAARAVALDDNERVALLHVRKHGYHKLPGGGVKADEDILTALKRELSEEIGCEAEVIDEIGEVIEYRDQEKMIQTSYCYLAKQIGEQRPPNFTQKEINDGFEIIWADDINAAISLLESDKPAKYGEHFMLCRDIWLLKTAREVLGYTENI